MQAKTLFPVLVILAVTGLLTIGAAGCGDDEGDGGTATVTETTGGEETETGETTSEAGDEAAPSGDAVRSARVEIEDFAYDPDPVTIEEGGKVTWINRDSVPHTATAEDGSFDTGTMEEGKIGSESFKEPGTYAYTCTIHPEMEGTVEVVAAG
jgi:plastocyanin